MLIRTLLWLLDHRLIPESHVLQVTNWNIVELHIIVSEKGIEVLFMLLVLHSPIIVTHFISIFLLSWELPANGPELQLDFFSIRVVTSIAPEFFISSSDVI